MQSVSLLHLFLYQLNLESIPEVKLHIMYSIPDLATHRLAVQPVLRSLQKLAENKRLQPLSIRLIGVLWQKQVNSLANRSPVVSVYTVNCRTEFFLTFSKFSLPVLLALVTVIPSNVHETTNFSCLKRLAF